MTAGSKSSGVTPVSAVAWRFGRHRIQFGEAGSLRARFVRIKALPAAVPIDAAVIEESSAVTPATGKVSPSRSPGRPVPLASQVSVRLSWPCAPPHTLDDPMANNKHVALLKQGVAAWNAWRKENSNISPDLIGANLIDAILREANLYRADLSTADLRGANLIEADLIGTDLSASNLSGTKFFQANLSGPDLNEADLSFADLTEANLVGADLMEANLTKANLTSARRVCAETTKRF